MKGVKIIIYVLALLLFVLNYQICDYFYYNDEIKDIKKWWGLKSNIYALICGLVLYGSLIGSKGLIRFVLAVFTGFCMSNIIDKIYFNVINFTYNDIIMIILTICFAYLDYLKNGK